MNDSSPPQTPWYHRNLWSNILGGVTSALVLGVLYWAFGLATAAKLPIWVYIAGIIVVVLVVSAIIPLWRRAIWGNVGRFLKWLWQWHPVSARRYQATRVHDIKMLLKAASDTDQAVIDSLPATIRDVIREDKESAERLTELMKPIIEQRVRHLQSSQNDPQAVPASGTPELPPPDPRWVFRYFGEKDGIATFEIENLMPDSVVYNARMEASPTWGFRHKDAAFWKDLSGRRTVSFGGEITGKARHTGLTFNLTWLDQDHDPRSDHWRIAAPDPAPEPDSDIWSTPYNDETPF